METRATEFAKAQYGLTPKDGPDDDQPDAPPSAQALPSDIFIDYAASKGESCRVVTMRKIWRTDGVLYVQGICHLRNKLRVFRADRIESLTCLATGEVPDDPEAWLADHALMQGDVEAGHTTGAIRACRFELLILAWLARSDRHFDPDELEVAIDFVMMATPHEIDRIQVAKYVGRISTSAVDIEACVAHVARNEAKWNTLKRAMRRLIDADGKVTVDEQIAVQRILDAYEVAALREPVADEDFADQDIPDVSVYVQVKISPDAKQPGGWRAIFGWGRSKA